MAQDLSWRFVQGRVVDVQARPIAAATVSIRLEGAADSRDPLAVGLTDGEGVFSLRGRWPASLPLTVVAFRPGYATATVNPQSAIDAPPLVLLDAGPLKLEVEDDGGRPISDCAVAATLDYRAHKWHDEHRTDPSGAVSFSAAPLGLVHLAVWHPDHGPVFVDHHHGLDGQPVRIRMSRGAGRQVTIRLAEAAALAKPELTLTLATRRDDRRRLPRAALDASRRGVQPWLLRGLPTDAELELECISLLAFVTPPMPRIPPGSDPVTIDLTVRAEFPPLWRPPIRFRVTGVEASSAAGLRLAVQVHNDARVLTTDADGTTRWPTRSIAGTQLDVCCLTEQFQVVAMVDATGRRATRVEDHAGPIRVPRPRARWKLPTPPEGDVEIGLAPARAIRGVVLAADGEPRPDVPIALEWEVPGGGAVNGRRWPTALATRSDLQGRFTFGGLREVEGTFRVRAADSDDATSPAFGFTDNDSARPFELSLPATAEIHGRITDPGGRPVPGAAVHLFQLTPTGVRTVHEAVADREGRYRFREVVPGPDWWIHPLSGQVPRPSDGHGRVVLDAAGTIERDLVLGPEPAAKQR